MKSSILHQITVYSFNRIYYMSVSDCKSFYPKKNNKKEFITSNDRSFGCPIISTDIFP